MVCMCCANLVGAVRFVLPRLFTQDETVLSLSHVLCMQSRKNDQLVCILLTFLSSLYLNLIQKTSASFKHAMKSLYIILLAIYSANENSKRLMISQQNNIAPTSCQALSLYFTISMFLNLCIIF